MGKISQAEMARQLDVSVTTIRKYLAMEGFPAGNLPAMKAYMDAHRRRMKVHQQPAAGAAELKEEKLRLEVEKLRRSLEDARRQIRDEVLLELRHELAQIWQPIRHAYELLPDEHRDRLIAELEGIREQCQILS